MSVAVLQKCLYISNTYVEKYTKSRKLNQDYSVKEGWLVVGLEDPTYGYRPCYNDYKKKPIFYIPRTYDGLPIVGVCYRAGDSFFNEYGTSEAPNICYHEENMLMLQPSRLGYVSYFSDVDCSYLIWERCLLQYKISINPSLTLLENMAQAQGYNTTFRYASIGKLVIAYDETRKFWDGKMRTQTTRDEANLTVVPTSGEDKFAEYRVGKYISSDESYRYWHRSVDSDTRDYFDKNSSVFGWVKRAYGETKITLPNFAIVSLNETSERIDVSYPDDPSSKYRT